MLRAVAALDAGEFAEFGRLMYESHASMRDDYEISLPRDRRVGRARREEIDGVLGARMTGGGFGGCTINLVRADAVERFAAEIVRGYRGGDRDRRAAPRLPPRAAAMDQRARRDVSPRRAPRLEEPMLEGRR